MVTIWDWLTVIAFAALVTLMLQRSTEAELRDELWQYAPPAIGCATANYVGNDGRDLLAAALLIAVIAYIFTVLKVQFPRF